MTRILNALGAAYAALLYVVAVICGLFFLVLALAGVSRQRMCGWFKDE